MKKLNRKSLIFIFALAVAAIPMLQGCGGGGGGGVAVTTPTTGAVRIAIPQPGASEAARVAGKVPSNIAALSISITGSLLSSPITRSVTYPTTASSLSIPNIPAGLNVITANATDADGNIIATRTQKVTIIAGVYIDLTMTLGYSIESGGFSPSSITFSIGDALVIKNNYSDSVTVSTSDTNCSSELLGKQGQIKCFPQATGNITITSGANTATAVVNSATNTSLKTGITANITYGEAPLYVYLRANTLSSSTGSGTVTYSWNLGGGTSQYSLTSQSTDASFSAPGDYTVTLTTTQGSETAKDTVRITVVSALPPTISSISPTSHLNTTSGTLTINGANFSDSATVKVGSTTVSASVSSSSVILATIPSGFTAGVYSIVVTNPDNQSATLSNSFTVSGPAPTVTAISPTSHLNSAAGTLSITGTNFVTGATVTLNSASVTATVNSATSISATIPSGFTPGSYTVTVTNPDSQSAAASQYFVVSAATALSCPPSGAYWFTGIGGSAPPSFYSFTGTITISGASASVSYNEGDNTGSSNNTPVSQTIAITDNGNGTFSPPDGSTIVPNNNCSIMFGSGNEVGAWDGYFMAKKGTAADYGAINPDGSWFGVRLSYESGSGYRAVSIGEYILSGGSISGTIYYINNMLSSEQQIDVSTLGLSYTYSSTTGAVTVTGDTADFIGGVSADGNTAIFGSSDSAMQAISIFVRKPATFTFANIYGQWRGLTLGVSNSNGENCANTMYIDSTHLTTTGRCHDSVEIQSDETDIYPTSTMASDFAVTADGASLSNLESPPQERIYVGEGESFVLTAETGNIYGQYFSIMFKTDQSVPTTQPPTANAGPDQNVTTGTTVTLNGSASSDPDGDTLTYDWIQTFGPTVTLSSETVAQPTFTPSSNGSYIFALHVDDGNFISATDTVLINASVSSVCGNSIVETGETCDDGNTTPGDGCDASCATETTPAPRVSSGNSHTCGINAGGAAKCWGYNGTGQVGDGTVIDRFTPTQVTGLTSGVIDISGGDSHSCAVMTNGTVQCWGDNTYGQLGNNSTTSSLVPVNVSSVSTAIKVVAGFYHSCALLSSGSVVCWGDNTQFNQLGNGGSTNSLVPAPVSVVSNAIDISVGCSQTCALITGGAVMCWGRNDYGQAAGDGTTAHVATPAAIPGVTSVTSISAGQGWSCAGLTTGGTQCWGYNGSGQFGSGSVSSSTTPVAGVAAGGAPTIYSNFTAGGSQTCSTTSAGLAYCWGSNSMGQLGTGDTTAQTTPYNLTSMGAVDHISAGGYHTCAVNSAGAFYCWGDNSVGSVGIGSGLTALSPALVSGM